MMPDLWFAVLRCSLVRLHNSMLVRMRIKLLDLDAYCRCYTTAYKITMCNASACVL
jgi:hypothetical protein